MNKETYNNDQNFCVMPLPFRKSGNKLECNYVPVLQRFHGLLFQIRMSLYLEEKLSLYQNLISKTGEGSKWYLPPPPRGVIDRKTKKLRCVFDRSSEYKRLSLDDTFLQRPDLNNSLLGVLKRFRETSGHNNIIIIIVFLPTEVIHDHQLYIIICQIFAYSTCVLKTDHFRSCLIFMVCKITLV